MLTLNTILKHEGIDPKKCVLFAIKTPVLLQTAHPMTYGVLGMDALRPISGYRSTKNLTWVIS